MYDLSAAEKQIYAANCLEVFVRHFKIEDASVETLLAHLKRAGESDFGKWEREGAILPLNGRGDARPLGLEEKVPMDIQQDFFKLIDFVVEVGIVDSYGENSMLPLNFLDGAVEILRIHGVLPPKLDY
ncbi:hypothetical protein [Variovorax durovernensis]